MFPPVTARAPPRAVAQRVHRTSGPATVPKDANPIMS